MNKKVIVTILSIKAMVLIIVFLAFSFFPFNKIYYYSNFIFPLHDSVTLESAYKTWDAQHYLFISEKGYQKGSESDAFPPLFSFIIHMATYITRSSFVSGILLANLFSFFACYLFYILIEQTEGEKIAFRSLLFLLAFPTAFYFDLIYTEGLFFLLVMLFFLFLRKRRLLFASIAAFFIPLTRLIGAAIIIPFLFSYVLEYHQHTFFDQLQSIWTSLFQKKTLLLLSPLFGVVFCMFIFYVTTGSFFTQFTTQADYISRYSFFSIFNPIFFLRALFTFPLKLHGFTNSILDRTFFLFFITMLVFIYKRVSKVFFIYTLCFGLLPVLSGSFMSYMRYLLIVFPIFIALGKMSFEKKYTNMAVPFFFLSLMMQTFFIIMQSLNYWVS